MKKINAYYLIVTGLMSAFILLGAAMDIAKTREAVALISYLGYPEYFVKFIGALKIAGVVTILQPKMPKLKEWAYAGLTFDTLGALYSHFSTGSKIELWLPAFIGIALVLSSYYLYTKRGTQAIEVK